MPVYRSLPITISGSQVLFGDGTAAAPSMSFSADPDTGVYRPSNNQFGISLGGTIRLFMNGASLHVGNGFSSATPADAVIRATDGTGTNIAGAGLLISGGQSTGTGAGGAVRLFTSPAGSSGTATNSNVERMRITSAGEILAGTSTAQTGSRYVFDGLTNNFRIQGDTEARLLLEDKGVADASTPFGYFQSDGGSLIFGNANRSGTGTAGSTERMRITSGGDVGIGTNSPGARLGVAGSFQLTNSAGTVVLQRCGLGNDSILGTESGTSLLLRTGTTERMRVKADGQVRFIPLAADPASAEAGDVYYNSGTNKLRVYNGTAWVDLH